MDVSELDKLLADPRVEEELKRKRKENNDCDLPYLGGYSKDGSTLYYDRHLPKRITITIAGHFHTFDPRTFLRLHETLEKALIDALHFTYDKAHLAATAYERRGLTKRFGPAAWKPYSNALKPMIKADAHERLISVPSNLDMAPYLARPENRALVAAMRKAMGHASKVSQEGANYKATGGASGRHCGPVSGWTGDCRYFWPKRHCDIVQGDIEPGGVCGLWQKKDV